VKAGDTVLIQFGHNDSGVVNEDASVPPERRRARGSIPSLGEETQEIDNIITKKHEVVHTYGWYMRKMIADTKAKGATPIVLSLTVRNEWKDGKAERVKGPWRKFSQRDRRNRRRCLYRPDPDHRRRIPETGRRQGEGLSSPRITRTPAPKAPNSMPRSSSPA